MKEEYSDVNNFIIERDDLNFANSNITVDLDALMPVIREQLAAGQTVRFTPTGISMEPMLRHDKDNVVLSPVPEVLKRYDLPLYQRDNGQYVLHRVVEVQTELSGNYTAIGSEGGRGESTAYTCMGDNQFVEEPGLRHEQMIGRVTEFYRGDRRHSIDEMSYKIYCHMWYYSRHIRHFWWRAVRKLRRMLG